MAENAKNLALKSKDFPDLFNKLNKVSETKGTPETRPSLRKLTVELLHEACDNRLNIPEDSNSSVTIPENNITD